MVEVVLDLSEVKIESIHYARVNGYHVYLLNHKYVFYNTTEMFRNLPFVQAKVIEDIDDITLGSKVVRTTEILNIELVKKINELNQQYIKLEEEAIIALAEGVI